MSNWSDIVKEIITQDDKPSARRVLITGGAGFIGSHLTDYHIALGDDVHVVDNLSTGRWENVAHHAASANFCFSKANIVDWEDLSKAFEWADLVYHLAAIVGVHRVLADPIKTLDANLYGTRRVLEEAHNAKWRPHVIVASSSEVYGFNANSTFKEDGDLVFHSRDFNRWSYALSKLGDEFYANAYHDQCELSVSIARLFNTIGPRQSGAYGMVAPNFVHQAVRGAPLNVYGDGKQSRTFCDVRDTVRALEALSRCKGANGKIVNIGGEREIEILKLAELVTALAQSDSKIQFQSYERAYGEGFDDIKHRAPDITQLRELTSFSHQWSLEETLAEMIALEREKQETPDAVTLSCSSAI